VKKQMILGIFVACCLGLSRVHASKGELAERFDFGKEPMRYLENSRIRLGVDLSLGGAVTLLVDKKNSSANMINSHDWGRQIQLSYYSGPIPYIGPKGEQPHKAWAQLGWNPIQSGSVGRIKSRTLSFETPDAKTIRVRCVPMQWPHINVEGDCIFEVTYTLVSENTIEMKARLINQRTDKTQYAGRHQEMPALYTNGPWYKLVTYTGDAPFTDAPTTNIVDKGDGKGWPWSHFEATEHWSALVNDAGTGVGLYQPEVIPVTGGFAGGDKKKGSGGVKDMQTGYIAPIGTVILDHNIDWTFQTYMIVGSVTEIRRTAKALHGPLKVPSWRFADDRKGFTYRGSAKDQGWPIKESLQISYDEEKRGVVVSPITVWHAHKMPTLNLDAAFTFTTTNKAVNATIELVTFSGKRIAYPVKVLSDGKRQRYTIPLAVNAQYTGAMKQILLYMPKAKGSARVYQLQGQ
jgi:hypothetical protein